jgi:hypothetical protein
MDTPFYPAMLATSGGLLFTGKSTGEFLAVDMNTGKVRWQFEEICRQVHFLCRVPADRASRLHRVEAAVHREGRLFERMFPLFTSTRSAR